MISNHKYVYEIIERRVASRSGGFYYRKTVKYKPEQKLIYSNGQIKGGKDCECGSAPL